jgi:hypothetical protein
VGEAQKELGWVIVRGSILVGHHDRDCGSRVVNVERAASGNQFDEACAAVVVADIERNWQPVRAALAILAGLRFQDRKASHPNDVPKSAGFVLVRAALAIFQCRRNGHVVVIDCAGEKNRVVIPASRATFETSI